MSYQGLLKQIRRVFHCFIEVIIAKRLAPFVPQILRIYCPSTMPGSMFAYIYCPSKYHASNQVHKEMNIATKALTAKIILYILYIGLYYYNIVHILSICALQRNVKFVYLINIKWRVKSYVWKYCNVVEMVIECFEFLKQHS